jgi:hypothetical protein
MRKQTMYKIYKIANGDLTKEDFTEQELIERTISLAENNLIRKYLIYKGLDRKEQFLHNIIKVALPFDKKDTEMEKPLDVLNKGITFMKKKFVPLASSPSMMKKEGKDDYYAENYKCEYLFIAKEDSEFISIFEDITSLGKLTEKRFIKEELAINKDLIARLSLQTSSTYEIDYKPNVVILPTTTYTYISDYCYFKDKDYSKLIYERDREEEHEFQDGCGLMSYELAGIIKRSLNIDYTVDFAIIRQDITATKGLVVKVDFNKYFEDTYTKDIPNIFEKREDGFYTLDYFNKMVNISKADLIITTNMAKWAKWWDSQEQIEEELKKEKYDKYRDILTNLYVSKINKKQPKEYSRTNYQVISNLNLTPLELEALSQETYSMYEKVVDGDINAIRLMLGDISNNDKEELEAMDKLHYLLQSTEDAIKIPWVQKMVMGMVRKKIAELQEGKFFVKGNYKYASTCPITFMDWIMTRKISDNGLGVNEFYIPQEAGKRVMARSPLNSFSEIHKFTIAKNNLLEEYVGKLTNELIFFNQKDNRLALNSGEDTDGDSNLVMQSDIIYDSVIAPEDDYNFLNLQDKKDDAVKLPYTKENEYYSVVMAAGNQIGSISNLGIKICTQATELGYKYAKTGEVFTYKYLRKKYDDTHEQFYLDNISEIKYLEGVNSELSDKDRIITEFKYMLNEEELIDMEYDIENLEREKYQYESAINKKKYEYFTAAMEEKISEGEFIPVENLEEQEIKNIITKQFYQNKRLSYLALELQMISIDSPKTLKKIDDDTKKLLKESLVEEFNPNFRKYTTKYEDRSRVYSRTHSVLNLHSNRIVNTLFEKYYKKKEKVSKGDRVTVLHNILANIVPIKYTAEVSEIIKNIFEKWRSSAEDIRIKFKDNIPKRSDELKKNNLDASKSIIELTDKHEITTTASALLLASKSSKSDTRSKFIIDCCFNIVQAILDTYYTDITSYIEDPNGIYHYKFKNYSKIKTQRKKQDMQLLENLQNELRLAETILIKFRPVDLDNAIITKNDGKFFINNVEIYNNKVKGAKKKIYDLLEDYMKDKDELEVNLKNIEIKPSYISAYIVC